MTLRNGAQVTLRPIAPEDRPLVAASFERLSSESRYGRFLTTTSELSPAGLDFLVDVDHTSHEAIIALDRSGQQALGVARYIRSPDDPQIAEVAVTVTDDWQGCGLGRALLDRLTYRARREGVRRFSALILPENRRALALMKGLGETRFRADVGALELVIDLPPSRGMGARLARALRTAAAESLVPGKTIAQRVAFSVSGAPPTPLQPHRAIRTVVIGAENSESGRRALTVGLELGAILGTTVHVVAPYGATEGKLDAEAAVETAARAARARGLETVTHVRLMDAAEALLAVAREQHADLLIVDASGMRGASRLPLGAANLVSHNAPCSVLLVHPH